MCSFDTEALTLLFQMSDVIYGNRGDIQDDECELLYRISVACT
jgi:hypothetical protein